MDSPNRRAKRKREQSLDRLSDDGSCDGMEMGSSQVGVEFKRRASWRDEEDDEVWIVRKVHDSSQEEVSLEETGGESSHVWQTRQMREVGSCWVGAVCLHEAADNNDFAGIFKGRYTKEDVNRPNDEGETPLHYAAEIGSESVVGLLIDKGADVGAEDDHGLTPLSLAANYGHVGVCEMLLDAGASVNYQDALNMTALHFAASMGHANVVQLLLSRGAEPTLRDDGGDRPSDYAHASRESEIEKYLIQAEARRLPDAMPDMPG